MADHRQQTHPTKSPPIYQRGIESLIQQTKYTAYVSAVSFLHKTHDLMLHLHQQTKFQALVAHLRQTDNTKRNFVPLLKQQW